MATTKNMQDLLFAIAQYDYVPLALIQNGQFGTPVLKRNSKTLLRALINKQLVDVVELEECHGGSFMVVSINATGKKEINA